MADTATYSQPIIRGIQAVGAVELAYRYNNVVGENWVLPFPDSIALGALTKAESKITAKKDDFVKCAGFRLDASFLDANQQIASSFVIPLLGGGGFALTNNNRSGTLTIAATRVSRPLASTGSGEGKMLGTPYYTGTGAQAKENYYMNDTEFYDISLLAQIQQAQEDGDSVGATLRVSFKFNGKWTILVFQGCTVASVKPVALAGNNAVDYQVAFNYLNWEVTYSADSQSSTQAATAASSSTSNSSSGD